MFIRRIGIISRTYRHMNRYRRILSVLFKYGFGDLIDRLNIGQYLEIGMQMVSRTRRERMESLTRSERVRMALEELGPTFTKMGQILSTRPDLIPSEFIAELSKLQDSVPPFPFDQVREIIEAELKAPVEALFETFEETPLAAASIGQVHRARLRSGEDVVVKVQRPGIRRTIEIDLEILLHLAQLVEKHVAEVGFYKPTRIVNEFARILEKEIDYTIEASHTERFARYFSGNPHVYVPKVYREMTSERVLTMEYAGGIKVSEVEKLDRAGFDRAVIASRGADLMLEQVFEHGFFHGDPHPGNIYILPGQVICYFDFGMMGSVDRKAREDFADLVYGYVRRDEARTADALLRIVEWDREPDRRGLERDISEFMELYLYKPLKGIRLKAVLLDMIDLLSRHGLRLPPDVFLMIKSMTEVEGIGLMLNPDFDLVEKAEPFIRRIKAARYRPGRIMAELAEYGHEWMKFLRIAPVEFQDLLKQIRQGKTRIGFEHKGLDGLIFELDRSSNRIAFSLIISSLIIGSSLIMATDIGPYLFGFPLLGLAGFTIAGIFGIWLVISIFRSGRL
ncbi:MAG: ABC1 kinase family protein [Syntrophales bacterium]